MAKELSTDQKKLLSKEWSHLQSQIDTLSDSTFDLIQIGAVLNTLESLSELYEKLPDLLGQGFQKLNEILSHVAAAQVDYSEGISHTHTLVSALSQAIETFLTGDANFTTLQSFFASQQIPMPGEHSKADGPDYTQVVQEVSSDLIGDSVLTDFLNEADEGLESIESDLLALEQDPQNKDLIDPILRIAHTMKGTAGFLGLKVVGEIGHKTEDLLVQVRDQGRPLTPQVIDASFSAIDAIKHLIEQLKSILQDGTAVPIDIQVAYDQLDACLKTDFSAGDSDTSTTKPSVSDQPPRPLGQILVDEGVVTEAQVQEALDSQAKPLGELLVDQGIASKESVQKALDQQKASGKANDLQDMVKVPAQKLDDLSELVGEVVVALSLLSQSNELLSHGSMEVFDHLDQLDKATEKLRDQVIGIRMFPVGTVFTKLSRQVRDLSKKLNKPINLNMEGTDTLVDKVIIDGIYGPMVHLVRNAIDHGIEDTETRSQKGKSSEGHVTLKAQHAGDSVIVTIQDDGKGLDRDMILKKAIEKQLITAGASLSDQQIFSLILQPGFSTAAVTTDVSGRGVGMDVVRRDIENLRGKLLIDSVPNQGSTFTIKLPLNTSIIEGLVTQVGNTRFIIPILDVLQTITPKAKSLRGTQGQENVGFMLAGDLIPIIRFYELCGIQTDVFEPTASTVLVVALRGKKYGIMVDEMLHRQQIVIKNLGPRFSHLKGISGGTILGDGRVGFILDVEEVIRHWKDNTELIQQEQEHVTT